jgi:hypothetical protein
MRAVKSLKAQFAASPLLARMVPLLAFLLLTAAQGWLGEAGRYWIYAAKTLVGAWLVWLARPYVAEMRWAFSWEAVVVGVAVFVVWVGLDPYYPGLQELPAKLGFGTPKPPGEAPPPWNPFAQFGAGSALAWFFVVVRTVGTTLVVPPLEEVFYRSFLYRFIAKADFLSVPFRHFAWTPFLVTSLMFGLQHEQWLAGILCGMAYQWVVIRKGRLGDAMTAHGLTNFLLGVYVVWKGAWQFW